MLADGAIKTLSAENNQCNAFVSTEPLISPQLQASPKELIISAIHIQPNQVQTTLKFNPPINKSTHTRSSQHGNPIPRPAPTSLQSRPTKRQPMHDLHGPLRNNVLRQRDSRVCSASTMQASHRLSMRSNLALTGKGTQ